MRFHAPPQRARGSLAQQRLELCEDLFDGIAWARRIAWLRRHEWRIA